MASLESYGKKISKKANYFLQREKKRQVLFRSITFNSYIFSLSKWFLQMIITHIRNNAQTFHCICFCLEIKVYELQI